MLSESKGNSLIGCLNKFYPQEGQTIMRIKFYQNTVGKEVAVTHFTPESECLPLIIFFKFLLRQNYEVTMFCTLYHIIRAILSEVGFL